MCGVATFLQANKVTGTGLPIVLGCTFTAVAPMILIGQTKGLMCYMVHYLYQVFWLSLLHHSSLFS